MKFLAKWHGYIQQRSKLVWSYIVNKSAIVAIFIMLFSIIMFSTQSKSSSEMSMKDNIDIKTNSDMMSKNSESIVIGLGCFWGPEKRFAQIPGVIDVVSGYADGRGFEANYNEIITLKNKYNPDNYAEVVKVTYNPTQVSTEDLFKAFYEQHDPTLENRQGNDIGTQYRSTILYQNDEQKKIADEVTAEYQTLLSKAGYGEIQTIIKPLDAFYLAEEFHQDYLIKNPNGYCPNHSTGVFFDKKETQQNIDNSSLLVGKQIVVIDSEDCPYCDKFKQDVAQHYQGSIPMTFRLASQLDGLQITSPTWATPTLLYLEDGVEQYAIQGYINEKDFYKALGHFKLGESEAFNVAFSKGTDSRFCKQYEMFKNTGDGVFVDKLSGDALFDTKDRFDSGSGWLSFTKAVDDSVTYHEDNSYGMRRTEIKSKRSGIHLGHVFDDGPNGLPRYCINATVLEFLPRS